VAWKFSGDVERYEIEVTKMGQNNPLFLTVLTFVRNSEILRGLHMQTSCCMCAELPPASGCREKLWILRARSINEQVIRHKSPTSLQRTLEKWHLTKSMSLLYSSKEQPIQSPKYSSRTKYMTLAKMCISI